MSELMLIGLCLTIVCVLTAVAIGLSYLLVPAVGGWVVLLLILMFGCIAGFALVKVMERS